MAKYHRHDERNKHRGKKNKLILSTDDQLVFEEKSNKKTKYKKSISYDIDDYYAEAEQYEDI